MVSLEILEVIVIGAIIVELYSLHMHSKLEQRMDEHVLETNEALTTSKDMIKSLDENLIRLGERIHQMNEYIKGIDEHMIRFDQHLADTNIHLDNYHQLMIKLDDHMHALLNEYLKDYTAQHRFPLPFREVDKQA